MADTSQVEVPPHTNGISEDVMDEEERAKMRPADIDADVKEMERRKRVELIMNSKLFRDELERIIEVQLRDGSGTSGLMQQISDMMGVSKNAGNVFKNSNCVVPINDIRGIEAMGYAKGEKILRCKLAAVYRLIDLYGWTQGTSTLITARLNQDEEHFLVNPYGMLFHEITASSLIKADMQGNVVEQGTTNFGVNLSAYSLHAAIHSSRPDIKCIIHVHTPSVVAISALKCGLLPISQESVVIGEVSTHPYIGGVGDTEEKDKITRNLGPNNKVLLLTNQGAVCCGETIEEAFFNARNTVLASESQLKLMPMGIDNLIVMNDETRKKLYEAAHKAPESSPRPDQPSILETKIERKWRVGGVEFEALMRMLDNAGFRTGYIYRHPLVKGDPPRPRSDVEVPPAVSSLGYLLEEEELYKQGLWKKLEGGRKGNDRTRWLNSPNVYQKVEILETGTPDPKKITKWVADGSPTHSSTPVKIESALQFVPKNTNPKEFKKLQQQIKDYRRADKISAGPQSHILEGVTWEEARKMQDAGVTQTGDQVVLMGAASKGIIQRGFQHNATMYKSPYAKNPFDSITDEEIDEYKKVVEKKTKGEYDTDFSESEGLSSAQINKRISDIRSPTSAASETEEESRDEPQVLRIETKQAPKPSQPEVVLSDDVATRNLLLAERKSATNSMRSSNVVKLVARMLGAKATSYRTNTFAGFPSGSYAVPNPKHYHIARCTKAAPHLRPKLIKFPDSNLTNAQEGGAKVSINVGDRSFCVGVSVEELRSFIVPFADTLNLIHNCGVGFENAASQTCYNLLDTKTEITPVSFGNRGVTPLMSEENTREDSGTFERDIMRKLRENLVDDMVNTNGDNMMNTDDDDTVNTNGDDMVNTNDEDMMNTNGDDTVNTNNDHMVNTNDEDDDDESGSSSDPSMTEDIIVNFVPETCNFSIESRPSMENNRNQAWTPRSFYSASGFIQQTTEGNRTTGFYMRKVQSGTYEPLQQLEIEEGQGNSGERQGDNIANTEVNLWEDTSDSDNDDEQFTFTNFKRPMCKKVNSSSVEYGYFTRNIAPCVTDQEQEQTPDLEHLEAPKQQVGEVMENNCNEYWVRVPRSLSFGGDSAMNQTNESNDTEEAVIVALSESFPSNQSLEGASLELPLELLSNDSEIEVREGAERSAMSTQHLDVHDSFNEEEVITTIDPDSVTQEVAVDTWVNSKINPKKPQEFACSVPHEVTALTPEENQEVGEEDSIGRNESQRFFDTSGLLEQTAIMISAPEQYFDAPDINNTAVESSKQVQDGTATPIKEEQHTSATPIQELRNDQIVVSSPACAEEGGAQNQDIFTEMAAFLIKTFSQEALPNVENVPGEEIKFKLDQVEGLKGQMSSENVNPCENASFTTASESFEYLTSLEEFIKKVSNDGNQEFNCSMEAEESKSEEQLELKSEEGNSATTTKESTLTIVEEEMQEPNEMKTQPLSKNSSEQDASVQKLVATENISPASHVIENISNLQEVVAVQAIPNQLEVNAAQEENLQEVGAVEEMEEVLYHEEFSAAREEIPNQHEVSAVEAMEEVLSQQEVSATQAEIQNLQEISAVEEMEEASSQQELSAAREKNQNLQEVGAVEEMEEVLYQQEVNAAQEEIPNQHEVSAVEGMEKVSSRQEVVALQIIEYIPKQLEVNAAQEEIQNLQEVGAVDEMDEVLYHQEVSAAREEIQNQHEVSAVEGMEKVSSRQEVVALQIIEYIPKQLEVNAAQEEIQNLQEVGAVDEMDEVLYHQEVSAAREEIQNQHEVSAVGAMEEVLSQQEVSATQAEIQNLQEISAVEEMEEVSSQQEVSAAQEKIQNLQEVSAAEEIKNIQNHQEAVAVQAIESIPNQQEVNSDQAMEVISNQQAVKAAQAIEDIPNQQESTFRKEIKQSAIQEVAEALEKDAIKKKAKRRPSKKNSKRRSKKNETNLDTAQPRTAAICSNQDAQNESSKKNTGPVMFEAATTTDKETNGNSATQGVAIVNSGVFADSNTLNLIEVQVDVSHTNILIEAKDTAGEDATINIANVATDNGFDVSNKATIDSSKLDMTEAQAHVSHSNILMETEPNTGADATINVVLDTVETTHDGFDVASKATIDLNKLDVIEAEADVSHTNILMEAKDIAAEDATIEATDVSSKAKLDAIEAEADVSHANILMETEPNTGADATINVVLDIVEATPDEFDVSSRSTIDSSKLDVTEAEADVSHANILMETEDNTGVDAMINTANGAIEATLGGFDVSNRSTSDSSKLKVPETDANILMESKDTTSEDANYTVEDNYDGRIINVVIMRRTEQLETIPVKTGTIVQQEEASKKITSEDLQQQAGKAYNVDEILLVLKTDEKPSGNAANSNRRFGGNTIAVEESEAGEPIESFKEPTDHNGNLIESAPFDGHPDLIPPSEPDDSTQTEYQDAVENCSYDPNETAVEMETSDSDMENAMVDLIAKYLVKNCLELSDVIVFPELENDENFIELYRKLLHLYTEYFFNSCTDDDMKTELRLNLQRKILNALNINQGEVSEISDKSFVVTEFLCELLDHVFGMFELNRVQFDDFEVELQDENMHSTPETNAKETSGARTNRIFLKRKRLFESEEKDDEKKLFKREGEKITSAEAPTSLDLEKLPVAGDDDDIFKESPVVRKKSSIKAMNVKKRKELSLKVERFLHLGGVVEFAVNPGNLGDGVKEETEPSINDHKVVDDCVMDTSQEIVERAQSHDVTTLKERYEKLSGSSKESPHSDIKNLRKQIEDFISSNLPTSDITKDKNYNHQKCPSPTGTSNIERKPLHDNPSNINVPKRFKEDKYPHSFTHETKNLTPAPEFSMQEFEEDLTSFQVKRLTSGNEFYWLSVTKSPKQPSPKKPPVVINVDEIPLRPPPDLNATFDVPNNIFLLPILEESNGNEQPEVNRVVHNEVQFVRSSTAAASNYAKREDVSFNKNTDANENEGDWMGENTVNGDQSDAHMSTLSQSSREDRSVSEGSPKKDKKKKKGLRTPSFLKKKKEKKSREA